MTDWPMRATLIYNPNSGGTASVSPEVLTGALLEAGFEPVYEATTSEQELDSVLRTVAGLVVIAGGDGSVRAVATRLVGRNIPIAILPLGTANNISRTYGVEGDPLQIIAGLKDKVIQRLDVGRVRSPWGEDYFLEAMGFGLYADALAIYDPEKGKSILRSISSALQTLTDSTDHTCQIWLDGEEISGKYLLFEVMNTPAFGPRIKLAPEADPGDGWLDVVRICEDNRDSFLAYLTRLISEDLVELPSVQASRGRKLEISWNGQFPFHIDAEVRPQPENRPDNVNPALGARPASGPIPDSTVIIDLLPRAIEIWLPNRNQAVETVESVETGAPLPPPSLPGNIL